MSRTIYFIGAGFSKALGGPLQAEILPGILGLGGDDAPNYGNGQTFLGERDLVQHFIENAFPNVHRDAWKYIPLEDLFSILDRALLNKESFRKMSFEDLMRASAALVHTIIYFSDIRLRSLEQSGVLDQFITEIFKRRNENDSFCFITSNWDIIIDSEIFSKYQSNSENQNRLSFIDYGFDCYYLDDNPRTMAEHHPNSQKNSIFKLHGSLNWLYCPNCHQTLFKSGEKIALREFIEPEACPFCKRQNPENQETDRSPHLQSLIIMPTMLKELRNLHLQQVWHKAGLELAHADRVVFIGYSFPLADFEIRYLLSHYIKRDCEIKVVLHVDDDPQDVSDRYRQFLTEWRYRHFLGDRCRFEYDGFVGYVRRLSEENQNIGH